MVLHVRNVMAYLHVHQGMLAPQLGLTQIPQALPGKCIYIISIEINDSSDRIFTALPQEEELHTT